MAARRRKRRWRRNRGRFGFLYKLLSALLILAAILTGCFVFFRVDTIAVTGQSQYTEEEIIKSAGISRGDNLFKINKFQVAMQVLTQLPYVSEIAISRKLPDTMILAVTECVPVAALQNGGEWWLIDANCKLLERGSEELAQGMARIYGLIPLVPTVGTQLSVDEAGQQRLASSSVLLKVLSARGMEDKLDFLDVTANNDIRFGYENRLTVVLPLITDFDRAIFNFSRTLEEMARVGDADVAGTLYFTYADGRAHLLPDRWLPGVVDVPVDVGEAPAGTATQGVP